MIEGMHLEATQRFIRDYRTLPRDVQEQVKGTLQRLAHSPAHPSLRHKKMHGQRDIYEVRVTVHYRLTYQRVGRIGYLRRVEPHDMLRNP